LAGQGKYSEAIVEYDIVLSIDPNNPLYHNNKGLSLTEQGKYSEAIVEYDIAILLFVLGIRSRGDFVTTKKKR